MKLNVDGSFCEESKLGGAGMIMRNEKGEILFSACRFLETCSSPLEAELAACMEGCALALQTSDKPFIVEMDCAVAVVTIKSSEDDRSQFTYLVREVQRLLAEKVGSKVEEIRRDQNSVSDALAKRGRLEHTTNF